MIERTHIGQMCRLRMSSAGGILSALCGGRILLVSSVAIDKTTNERGVVFVVMDVMLSTMFILRRLSSCPESPA